MSRSGWCIEFWDFGAWNVWGGAGPFLYKKDAVAWAERANRDMTHEIRQGAFGGHRFRVRYRRAGEGQ